MLQDKKKNKVVHKAMRNVDQDPAVGRRNGPPGGVVTHTLRFDTSIAYV